ncbi:MAG TPA: biotin/lipoyl-containing protein, partial [Bryobacteraceae bacterium]|nr:biotin/lipoyl-containing protein [Bryobacteraceae bacterium]
MTDVVMPQMGESIVEGTLTKWRKKPGDQVERDEPLFEISTDKVDTEIPSPAAGTLAEVLVEEGKTVGINTVVGRIDESGGNGARAAAPAKPAAPPAPPPPAAAAPAPPSPPPQAPAPVVEQAEPGEVSGPLSPLVRKMARDNNIDLSQVKGTGAGGRITKQDVEAYLAQQQAAPAPPAQTTPQPTVPKPQAAPPAKASADYVPPAAPTPAKVRVEPMSAMRIKIAEHMVMSKRTSAHVTTIHKVDMTRVAKVRERLKADFQARYGLSLTY